jgi:hypothetical protein
VKDCGIKVVLVNTSILKKAHRHTSKLSGIRTRKKPIDINVNFVDSGMWGIENG